MKVIMIILFLAKFELVYQISCGFNASLNNLFNKSEIESLSEKLDEFWVFPNMLVLSYFILDVGEILKTNNGQEEGSQRQGNQVGRSG